MQMPRSAPVLLMAAILTAAPARAEAPGPPQTWQDVLDKEPVAQAPGEVGREDDGEANSGTRGAWGAVGGTIITTLSGGRIVPGPGDGDGTGAMRATVSPMKEQLCYQLTVQNVAQATRARISEGGRLRTGEPVIDLTPPVGGASGGCVRVGYALALRMVQRPWDYYVDVATEDYPGGAIRGQVGK